MKTITEGVFKRKLDQRIAKIIKKQTYSNQGTVIYTMEFQDTKERITVLEYCLLSEWVRIN